MPAVYCALLLAPHCRLRTHADRPRLLLLLIDAHDGSITPVPLGSPIPPPPHLYPTILRVDALQSPLLPPKLPPLLVH